MTPLLGKCAVRDAWIADLLPACALAGTALRAQPAAAARPAAARRSAVVVAAEGATAAAPAAFVPPALDPNTPSPIFGGSTGGLLRKAQVSQGPASPGWGTISARQSCPSDAGTGLRACGRTPPARRRPVAGTGGRAATEAAPRPLAGPVQPPNLLGSRPAAPRSRSSTFSPGRQRRRSSLRCRCVAAAVAVAVEACKA